MRLSFGRRTFYDEESPRCRSRGARITRTADIAFYTLIKIITAGVRR